MYDDRGVQMPMVLLTGRRSIRDKILEIAAEANASCLVSRDFYDFEKVLFCQRRLIIVGNDMVELIQNHADRVFPGWSAGLYRPQLEGVVLVHESDPKAPAFDNVVRFPRAAALHAEYVVGLPMRDEEHLRLLNDMKAYPRA